MSCACHASFGTHDLGTLECHQVNRADNTESSVEIAAAVIVNPVGKPAAKSAAKPASRKGKTATKTQKTAEPAVETTVAPEPDTQDENQEEAEAPATDNETNLDQTEVPGATRLEEPAAEAPAPKSVFGSKVKNIQEDAPAQTEAKAEAATAAQAETPRPVGASIFSKVGRAS